MDDPWSSSTSAWDPSPSSPKPPSSSTDSSKADALPTWSTTPKAHASNNDDDGWGGGGWGASTEGDGGGWGESLGVVKPEQEEEEEEGELEDHADEKAGGFREVDEGGGFGEEGPEALPEEEEAEEEPVASDAEENEEEMDEVDVDDVDEAGFEAIPVSVLLLSFARVRKRKHADHLSASCVQQQDLPYVSSQPPTTYELELNTEDLPSFPPAATFPSSPSFGDFGGFSSPQVMHSSGGDDDDPWGQGGGVVVASRGGAWGASEDEGDDWGEAAKQEELKAVQEQQQATKVDEWEEARRLAEKRQARAPTHVLNDLYRQWVALSTELFPDPEPTSEKVEGGEESATTPRTNELDRHLNKTLVEIAEPSLSSLLVPQTHLVASQPFKLTTTSRRFQDSLNRTSHLSSSSILISTTRRRPIGLSSPDPPKEENGSDWWGTERSMLGEPDAEAPKEFIAPAKRSFWGRRTSGMSISSIASVAGTKVGGPVEVPLRPTGSDAIPSSVTSPTSGSSRIMSNSSASARPSLDITPTSDPSSRPTTPRPPSPAPPAPPTADAPVAPSAVSRFLGRWSRKPAPRSSSVMNADGTPKELELSGGDFDFLEEHAYASSSAAGQKLMGENEENGLEGFKGLDGFLGQGTKGKEMNSTPLPQKLQPPPTSASRPATTPPPPPVFSELDFLDFGGPSTPAAPPVSQPVKPSSTNGSSSFDMWDDFMASPAPRSTSRSATPVIPSTTTIPRLSNALPPPAAPQPHVRSSTSPSLATPIAPLLLPTVRPSSTSPISPIIPTISSRSSSFTFPPPPNLSTPKASLSALSPLPVASSSSTTSMFDDDDGFGDFGSAPMTSGSNAFDFSSASSPSAASFSMFSSPPPPPPSSFPTPPSSSFPSFSPPPPPAPPPRSTAFPPHLQTSNLSTPFSCPTSQPPTPPSKSPRHAAPLSSSAQPPPVPRLNLISASPSKPSLAGLVLQGQEQGGKRWPGPISPEIPKLGEAGASGWPGGEKKEEEKEKGKGGGGLSSADLSFFDSL